MLKRLRDKILRKDEYVLELEREIEKQYNENVRLETKVKGLEELNKGLASDIASYKRKYRNTKKTDNKKGGQK